MNYCAIMATCGRHTLAERSLRFFLDQDYNGQQKLIIYNNSDVPLTLNLNDVEGWEQTVDFKDRHIAYLGNKKVGLINNNIDKVTKEPYKNLGAIYRDALQEVPGYVNVISFWDDDDIFLPNHVSEGHFGYIQAKFQNQVAYKPERSYYRHPGGIELMGNNLEPSVFVELNWVKEYGFSETTSDQHMPWFNSLLKEQMMFIDSAGKPTMIYNWGDTDIPTFKTSGNAGSPNNFDNYRSFSKDHGDRILTPWTKEKVEEYYSLVKRLNVK